MNSKISQLMFILIGLIFPILFTLHPMIVSNFGLMPLSSTDTLLTQVHLFRDYGTV